MLKNVKRKIKFSVAKLVLIATKYVQVTKIELNFKIKFTLDDQFMRIGFMRGDSQER